MAISKHKLTTKADRIAGGSAADLFLGPLDGSTPTLNGTDRLNGGASVDEIRATLGVGLIAPVMKNIERGVFTFRDADVVALDLVHAGQMRSLTLTCPADLSSAAVEIANAAAVSSLAILNGSDNAYEIDGLDSGGIDTFRLTLDAVEIGEVGLYSGGAGAFDTLAIALRNGVDAKVSGDCIEARNVSISSTGNNENTLGFDTDASAGTIRNLTISGTQNLTLYNVPGVFLNLKSFDSTAMSAITWVTIGGSALQTVTGGAGTEFMDIASIGGKASAPAQVKLGGGHDYLTLHYAFNAATQAYYGGSGVDTITLEGAAANLSQAAIGFENVHVNHASGLYDVAGMDLVNFLLFSTSSLVTIDKLVTGATLGIYTDVTTFLTVNVAKAASSSSDSLRVLLHNAADLGTSAAGFMAPELSDLQIDCYSGDHVMYLGSVGASDDAATVSITGSTHLELHASNASTSYIERLEISNDAGADISGLVDGTQAFVLTGATIIGGDGDDILVGGAGADTISTGGGDNTVIGSLGADTVDLLGGGSDVLEFTAQNQSSFGTGHDTIENFEQGTDKIDLSALGPAIFFKGPVPSVAVGMGQLSVSYAAAFFSTADHTLYIDLNRDLQFDAAHDFKLTLDGVSTLSSSDLLT